MLTLAVINDWHARQIDFVLAFPQANVRTDIYMHVPEKFVVKNHKLVLDKNAPHPSRQREIVKLVKNVYGLVDASYTWHLHVKKKGLIELGFAQSQVDPCLFYKDQVLFVLYVDDAICLTPEKKKADLVIKELQEKGYILTDEGSLSAYLGIKIDRISEQQVVMSQQGFIDRIIK